MNALSKLTDWLDGEVASALPIEAESAPGSGDRAESAEEALRAIGLWSDDRTADWRTYLRRGLVGISKSEEWLRKWPPWPLQQVAWAVPPVARAGGAEAAKPAQPAVAEVDGTAPPAPRRPPTASRDPIGSQTDWGAFTQARRARARAETAEAAVEAETGAAEAEAQMSEKEAGKEAKAQGELTGSEAARQQQRPVGRPARTRRKRHSHSLRRE